MWTWADVPSPCIDAGNPGCDPCDEWPFDGNRIDMGAYGGTAEASVPPRNWASIADLNNDGIVNLVDCAIFTIYWPQIGAGIPADLNRDQSVNSADRDIFSANWLWQRN